MMTSFPVKIKDYPYAVVNFESASFRTFRDFPERLFCDGEVSDDSGGVNAICGRPEIDDVISGMVLGMTLNCLHRVNYLPNPDATDLAVEAP